MAAFLEERAARTGSRRTVETYGRTVRRFMGTVSEPGSATPLDVHRFAYGLTVDGHEPSPSTVLTRLAAIGGLYEFAVRMRVIEENPAVAVRRPTVRLAPPRGLTATDIQRLLAVIPDTPAGLLDRALIVTALLTGLRRSELVSLELSHPAESSMVFYEVRTKGGAIRRRELPSPAWAAIVTAAEARGATVLGSGARAFPLSDSTFAAHLKRHATAAGLNEVTCHALRHSAAKLRRDAGASIEDVSAFLGHVSIATTAGYLRRLEDEKDAGWEAVALAIGLQGTRAIPVPDGTRITAGSQKRWGPDQAQRESGCANSRPPRRGAQLRAPQPRPDPSAAERRHEWRVRRRPTRARPSR